MNRGVPPVARARHADRDFLGFRPVSALVLALTGTHGAVPTARAVAVLVPLTAAGQLAGRPLFRRLAHGRRTRACSRACSSPPWRRGLLTVLL